MASRRNAQSTAAEVALVHLKNCLANLPSSLVSLLVNVNTPAQNVIVELSFRSPAPADAPSSKVLPPSQRSVFLGWTGMPSKRRLAPLVDRDAFGPSRGASAIRDKELSVVEIDATFAATLGIQDGHKVMVSVHVDPPLAHTVNIEPLTPDDWEIIELHATFLELNMLSQIRALPNPADNSPTNHHPLTLHLSPTSTANIKVISFEPPLTSDNHFAKIAPDAEVIVAPKTRTKSSRSNRDNTSIASTSRRSGKSSAGTVRHKGVREERKSRFFRGVSRALCQDWFYTDDADDDLSVWVDRDLTFSKDLKGVTWVAVSVVKPASLENGVDNPRQQQNQDAQGPNPAQKVVARLRPWDDPPNGQAVAMSLPLCAALACEDMVGGVVKLEATPPQLSRKTAADTDGTSRNMIQRLTFYPFQSSNEKSSAGLRLGGTSKAELEEAGKRIQQIYGAGLFQGPLVDGQVMGVHPDLVYPTGWNGGIIKFDPVQPPSEVTGKDTVSWILGSAWHLPIDVQTPIPCPRPLSQDTPNKYDFSGSVLVGIDQTLTELRAHLSLGSSVLLTGGLGSGKTAVAKAVVQKLRADQLYYINYFSCTKLVNDESRISTIKETLTRLFMAADWGSRLGGNAIVILDDLDKLCPAETELQVGNENGRSRQISEAISSIVRQYCQPDQNTVILATCQAKDMLHNVLVGGHIVREIVDLHAPDKEARRRVLEQMTKESSFSELESDRAKHEDSRPTTANGSANGEDGDAWMDSSSPSKPTKSSSAATGFIVEQDLDFLDIAGQIDGYMPGDIKSLVARARSETLIRAVSDKNYSLDSPVRLERIDFDKALEGFTPASLRNVTLQSSTITFDSIGGLKETRRILLETLQYPTKYAPIFAQCPLRLRSGLLLYGYPGCGKTLLASAVAGECGLNFISVKGPEILNKYIGASEKSVRDLFARAQAARPCVLFFDEFDSIAPKRGHDSTGVTDRVVNQLLTQMDGAEGLSGVYVLAATSRPDLIDPALLRPGRLDKSLLCDFPDLDDRLDILRALAKKVKLADEVLESEEDLVELGKRTDGFSGADLQALVSNAQLLAIHDVLNDRDGVDGAVDAGSRRARAKKTNGTSARSFVQFRYGQEESEADAKRGLKSGASLLAEQAAISAKLQSIKLSRKRAQRRDQSQIDPAGGRAPLPSKEVVIGWTHLAGALDETRASISAEERRRLERIYREFVVGRSGEMKDGQGSMEIGGRSSLM